MEREKQGSIERLQISEEGVLVNRSIQCTAGRKPTPLDAIPVSPHQTKMASQMRTPANRLRRSNCDRVYYGPATPNHTSRPPSRITSTQAISRSSAVPSASTDFGDGLSQHTLSCGANASELDLGSSQSRAETGSPWEAVLPSQYPSYSLYGDGRKETAVEPISPDDPRLCPSTIDFLSETPSAQPSSTTRTFHPSTSSHSAFEFCTDENGFARGSSIELPADPTPYPQSEEAGHAGLGLWNVYLGSPGASDEQWSPQSVELEPRSDNRENNPDYYGIAGIADATWEE